MIDIGRPMRAKRRLSLNISHNRDTAEGPKARSRRPSGHSEPPLLIFAAVQPSLLRSCIPCVPVAQAL
jgi:hypothetical protein